MAEERSLPGWPKKKLVKEVRRHLSVYGFRPVKHSVWHAAWQWADRIANSHWHVHWPLPSEIGTQYILLLLAQMHDSRMLRLPFQAMENMPPEVAAMLLAVEKLGFPTIEIGAVRAHSRRKPPNDSQNDSSKPALF